MNITVYIQEEKRKSHTVLEAFASGCGARIASTAAHGLEPGAAAFYGVRPAWKHLWDQAVREDRQRYYIDNAYLDAAREKQFRVGVGGALQTWSQKPSDGSRLKALGIEVKMWRTAKDGAIYVCPQSVEFMQTHFENSTWTNDHFALVKKLTRRPAILRNKKDGEPFAEVLKRAWIVVAHSSSAAIEALIAGVPVIVTDPHCAAARFSTPMDRIESPLMPEGREAWAKRLADSQWTLAEFRDGAAWRAING